MKRIIVFFAMIMLFCALSLSISAETTCTHEYESVVTVDPTCQTEGQLRKTCTLCGDRVFETIEIIGHNYKNAVLTVKPTCTTDGKVTYTCIMCNGTLVETVEKRHVYHSEVTKVATCTEQGLVTYTCECGHTYKETTDYVHQYVETVKQEPTCTVPGTVVKKCTLCKAETTGTIPVKHDQTMVLSFKAPSCFVEGSVEFYCRLCETKVTETIAKTHSYEAVITTEATCTTNGVLRHSCVYCHHSHTDVIVAKHTYDINGTPTSIVYTDFTQTGIKYFSCEKCDSSEGLIANPIFIFSGYSATAYTEGALVEISCGYKVDLDALKDYQAVNANFKWGVIGAYESLFKDKAPLVSETGLPSDENENSEGKLAVKQIRFTQDNYATVDAKLINIDFSQHTTYFYLCLYIFDGEKTVYISDDSCRLIPLPVSYAMLFDGGDHDDVGTNRIDIGGMTYSTIEGTEPTEVRLVAMKESASLYKQEASTADSVRDENTISSIGGIGSWAGTIPNANELLNYYLELGGDATHYHNLDVESLITENSVAKGSWQSSINNILRAAELMAINGEKVNIDQTAETQVQLTKSNSLWSSNRDWYLSFIDGLYYTDTDLNDLTVTTVDGVKTYSATIVYTVIDYYSFLQYKDDTSTESFLLWGPTKKELAQLHLDGNALDFLIESTITYNVTWTAGERVAKDENFNSIKGFENETVNSSILTKVTE